MANLLLDAIGGWDISSHPPMPLSALDEWVSHLTANAIERSTKKGYSTGVKSYVRFCLIHNLPLNPTPQNLARYIAYVSQYINSAPQYLSGIRHFLLELSSIERGEREIEPKLASIQKPIIFRTSP